jgi:SWI/SNF-related matrix-associated actin-dependent regulator of chromatin subfamily D
MLTAVYFNNKKIFGAESVNFHALPELVNHFLAPPDPIILHYTLDPTVPPSDRPQAWDIEVKMEDTTLKNRVTVALHANKDTTLDLAKLDEEVCITPSL